MVFRPAKRPIGLWILTVSLLLSPLLHLVALMTGVVWLNFGSSSRWDGAVYLVVAPMVGYLLLSRHERARFSSYVFLSCELLRAQRIHSPGLAFLTIAALLYLQLPDARRIHPRIRPRDVLARIGIRRKGSKQSQPRE